MSKNVTIDNLAQVTIKLGDYFSFPDNFKKLFKTGGSELESILEISLVNNKLHKLNYTIEMVSYTASKIVSTIRRMKIGETPVKELMGNSLENFMDSNRYETTVDRNPNTLIF